MPRARADSSVPSRDRKDGKGDDRATRRGYTAAIVISALGHAVFFVLVLVILPSLMSSRHKIAPAYTVKIVDSLPAGQLGTHLPPLEHRRTAAHARPPEKHRSRPKPPEPKVVTPITQPPQVKDKTVIALNTRHRSTPTPTPTPTPAPVSTPEPTPAATPTPQPVHKRKKHVRPKPTPTPRRVERHEHKPKRHVEVAKPKPTPNVKEQLAKLRQRLLAEHLASEAKQAKENAKPAATPGAGGLLIGKAEIGGPGAGIGPGSGSVGVQQELDFLLYYRAVREKIKKAWSFSGGNKNLTTSVLFAIGPDGKLTGVKIIDSSHDPAFDDSVIRAIRRAAPFAPPPEKYRPQFSEGIEAVFKLGELTS